MVYLIILMAAFLAALLSVRARRACRTFVGDSSFSLMLVSLLFFTVVGTQSPARAQAIDATALMYLDRSDSPLPGT